MGESNVRGGAWLTCDRERWADILWRLLEDAQKSPLDYHNAGVGACVISPRSPGYAASTKPSVAERLDAEVISHQPDLVVVACGMNDVRSGINLEVFAEQFALILQRLQGALDARIVVANMYYVRGWEFFPPFDRGSVADAMRINETIRELAGDMHCIYADIWAALAQSDHVIHADSVHLNKIGNLLVAHKVFEAIVHAAPKLAQRVSERDAKSEWARRALERRHTAREDSHPQPLSGPARIA